MHDNKYIKIQQIDNLLQLIIQIEIMSQYSEQGWDIKRHESSDSQTQPNPFINKIKAIDFTDGSYSLQPDMVFGWKPKLPLGPVPLTYYNLYVDWLISYIHSDDRYKLIYLGNRISNSVKVNQLYDYSWKMRQKYNLNMKILKDTVQKIGVSSNKRYLGIQRECQYTFNSNFQSGNLDAVIQVKPDQFDCFIRSDTNTRGHCNWYYFSIKNKQILGKIKINICNFTKKANLYSKGMKPFVKQVNKAWRQGGEEINFVERYCRYGFDIKHYQLQFTYNFTDSNQQVFFAYGIPYNYSKLQSFLREIRLKYHEDTLKIQTLCESLGGLALPLLTITDGHIKTQKFNVLITARIHPGESVSSHVIQGFIRRLLENNPESQYLRSNFIFTIIPMLNPDGVVIGNFRASYSGKDLNRQFYNLNKLVFPEIYGLNQLSKTLKRHYNKNFEYYFDFHGHSTKTNFFCYGPEHMRWNIHYLKCRAFAKIFEEINPIFSYKRSIFTISEHKKTTARANMFLKLKIPMAYTFEMSNGLFQDKNNKLQEISEKEMYEVGDLVVKGLTKFSQLNYRHKQRQKSRKSSLLKRVKDMYQIRFSSNKEMINEGYPKSQNQFKKLKAKKIFVKSKEKHQEKKECKSKGKSNKQIQILKYNSEDVLQEIFNEIRNQNIEKVTEGGSDSEDQNEDLDRQDTNKLFHQIENREIKKQIQIHALNSKPTQVLLRETNKQNEIKSATLACKGQLDRKILSRSVTAKIRKIPKLQSQVQQKYLLAQKSFVLNI